MNTIRVDVVGSDDDNVAMDHKPEVWNENEDYKINTTVLHNGFTWYCHRDIAGDPLNMIPADDAQHWHLYIGSSASISSSVLSQTGDIVISQSGSAERLPIGRQGQVLFRAGDGELSWEFPNTGDGREDLAMLAPANTLVTSEKYNIKEDTNSMYYYCIVCRQEYESDESRSANVPANSLQFLNLEIDWVSCTPFLRDGLINSSFDLVNETINGADFLKEKPTSEEFYRIPLVGGRFYHDNRSNVFGGLYNIDRVSTRTRASNLTYLNDPVEDYVVDHTFTDDDIMQEARRLSTANALSLQLNLSDDLEWRIFNEATAPNDRNLYPIDYLRTKDESFIFLCAPADDPTSTMRTIWQIGGVQMRDSQVLENTRLCNRNAVDSITNSSPYNVTTNLGVFGQWVFLKPPQFNYETTSLTQIAVADEYEELFLLDPDAQYDSPFFIPADSTNGGAQFLVKMADGSWELHGLFDHDGNQRTGASTAIKTYPSDVTNRDHISVNMGRDVSHTATMNPWRPSSVTTTGDLLEDGEAMTAINIARHFDAWKSGDSQVTVIYDTNANARRTINLTVGSETVKQVKVFNWWANYDTGLGAGLTHLHPSHFTVFVVTEEGNVWIAGDNNSFQPLTSDSTLATLSIPALPADGLTIGMTQLTGAWDGDVQRVECQCISGDIDTNFRSTEESTDNVSSYYGLAPDGIVSIANKVAIVTTSSVFVHEVIVDTESAVNANATTTGGHSVRLRSNGTLFADIAGYGTDVGLNSLFNPQALSGTTQHRHASASTIVSRWTRGDIPNGIIERVAFGGASGEKSHSYVVNDFGLIYRFATRGDSTLTNRLHSGRLRMRLLSGGIGRHRPTVANERYAPHEF